MQSHPTLEAYPLSFVLQLRLQEQAGSVSLNELANKAWGGPVGAGKITYFNRSALVYSSVRGSTDPRKLDF
jgi:hypothetical protein